MTDFIVVSLFKATSSLNPQATIYREVFSQVRAFDVQAAMRTAEERGKLREGNFDMPLGHTISWSFEKIIEVSPMLETVSSQGIKDLYSRDFDDIHAYTVLTTVDE